jgi:Flp pilus assembly protein TadG
MLRRSDTISRYFSSDAGSVLAIAALVLPVIIGFAGVGVDASNWMMARRHLQTEADAAALAAAWDLSNGGTTSAANAAALKEATNNGYNSSSGTLTTTVTTGAYGIRTVKVDMQEAANLWFSRIFIDSPFYVGATASAQEVPGGAYCVLALDLTASGAISTGGSASVNSTTCGLAANSSSSTSVTVGGSSTLHVGAVTLAGSYQANSGFTYTSIHTHASQVTDPYASLTVPASSCTAAQVANSAHYTSSTTLNPGTFCGGISITGNNTRITLNPGVYIMDGGDLSMTSGGITGAGVTIILKNSRAPSGSYGNISLSGNSPITLTAPTTGTYAGIAVYQDRNAPASNAGNAMTGTSTFDIEGAVYTPSRSLSFGGNSTTSTCTQLLAKTVAFQGNPVMNNTCANAGTKSIGAAAATAKLVL